ncbi:MAG: hypothetical protein ACREE4_21770 [Stellaceae bacterium]
MLIIVGRGRPNLRLAVHSERREAGGGLHGLEAKMLLHRYKIAVIVQQRVAMFDAKGADDNVGCVPDRNPQFSQRAVISGRAGGQIGIKKRHPPVLAQRAFNAPGVGVVPSALEHFEQDKITNQERFPCNGFLQFVGRRCAMPAQVRSPRLLSHRKTSRH